MKRVIIVLLLIVLAACSAFKSTDKEERARDVHDELVYFKDCATDICFAAWQKGVDPRSFAFTDVACTEKVEAKLINRCPTAEAPR